MHLQRGVCGTQSRCCHNVTCSSRHSPVGRGIPDDLHGSPDIYGKAVSVGLTVAAKAAMAVTAAEEAAAPVAVDWAKVAVDGKAAMVEEEASLAVACHRSSLSSAVLPKSE